MSNQSIRQGDQKLLSPNWIPFVITSPLPHLCLVFHSFLHTFSSPSHRRHDPRLHHADHRYCYPSGLIRLQFDFIREKPSSSRSNSTATRLRRWLSCIRTEAWLPPRCVLRTANHLSSSTAHLKALNLISNLRLVRAVRRSFPFVFLSLVWSLLLPSS